MARMTDQGADAVVEQILDISRRLSFTDAGAIADAADRLHLAVQAQLVRDLIEPVLRGFAKGAVDERNRKAFELAQRAVNPRSAESYRPPMSIVDAGRSARG